MKKGNAVWMVLAILFAATTIILGVQYFTGSDNAAVASVNGEKIMKAEFYERLKQVGGEQTMDQMIQEKLVNAEARKQGITVTDAELTEAVNQLKAQYGGDVGLAQALAQAHLTMDQLKDIRRTSLLVKKMVEKTITTNDADLVKWFGDHKADFAQVEEVAASHILVDNEADAKAIRAELDKGADFATLAKAKSKDTAANAKGGDLGYFTRDKMVKEFSDVAFAMKVGDISQPVKTEFGYHIIKVTDHKQASTPTFESVKDKVKTAYIADQLQTKQPEFIDSLKKAAKIDNKLFPVPAAPVPGK